MPHLAAVERFLCGFQSVMGHSTTPLKRILRHGALPARAMSGFSLRATAAIAVHSDAFSRSGAEPCRVPSLPFCSPASHGPRRRSAAAQSAQSPGGPGSGATSGADRRRPRTEGGRYTFHRMGEGFVRLDSATGQVAQCRSSATGWSCQAAPDERLALESEIAQAAAGERVAEEIDAGARPRPAGRDAPPRRGRCRRPASPIRRTARPAGRRARPNSTAPSPT